MWYLLHFRYTTAYISNTRQIEKELSKELGEDYQKNKSYFNVVLANQPQAISNATNLSEYHQQNGTSKYSEDHNPYTEMHLIVKYLNELNC